MYCRPLYCNVTWPSKHVTTRGEMSVLLAQLPGILRSLRLSSCPVGRTDLVLDTPLVSSLLQALRLQKSKADFSFLLQNPLLGPSLILSQCSKLAAYFQHIQKDSSLWGILIHIVFIALMVLEIQLLKLTIKKKILFH